MPIKTWQYNKEKDGKTTRIMVCDGDVWLVQTVGDVTNNVLMSAKKLRKLLKRYS